MRFSWRVIVLSTLVLSACGEDDPPATTPTPEAVTRTVGVEGGTLEIGGATMTIPPGALAAPTPIRIDVSASGPPAGFVALSKVFRCEPVGTTFAVPVTMRMPFVDDGGRKTMFWSSGADPSFKDVGGEATGGVMSATIRHFSAGFIGRVQ